MSITRRYKSKIDIVEAESLLFIMGSQPYSIVQMIIIMLIPVDMGKKTQLLPRRIILLYVLLDVLFSPILSCVPG